jgi:hypothetical protein
VAKIDWGLWRFFSVVFGLPILFLLASVWFAGRGTWKTWLGVVLLTMVLYNGAMAAEWHQFDQDGRAVCFEGPWPECLDAPGRAAFGFLAFTWLGGNLVLIATHGCVALSRRSDRGTRIAIVTEPPPMPAPPASPPPLSA